MIRHAHPVKTAILTLCFGLAFTSMLAAQQGAKGKAVAVQPTFDAGTVPKGEQITHDFLIKNEGTATLEITRAEPGCGCTVANFDKQIAPGQTGKVHAVLDTSGFNGPISKGITVYTSDPENPQITLTLQAKVEPHISMKPGYARFLSVQGEAKTGTVSQTIWSPDGTDFSLVSVTSPFPFIKVEHREATAEEREGTDLKGRQWRVDLTLDNFAAPVGSLADYIQIVTDHPKQKTLQIPVSGFVRPVLAVTPPAGDFGRVEVKEAVKKSINVRNFASENIKLTAIENSMAGQGLEAQIDPIEEGREYMVRLLLSPEAPKGPFEATITLKTDSAKIPQIQVSISGTVL